MHHLYVKLDGQQFTDQMRSVALYFVKKESSDGRVGTCPVTGKARRLEFRSPDSKSNEQERFLVPTIALENQLCQFRSATKSNRLATADSTRNIH